MSNDFLSDYLQSLHGIPVLGHEEEYELADRIQAGDQAALAKLIQHNLRFVIFVVRKLAAWSHSRVPQEDLIGFGNEGLLKAARVWVPTNGAKFATYAKPFILRAVERGLQAGQGGVGASHYATAWAPISSSCLIMGDRPTVGMTWPMSLNDANASTEPLARYRAPPYMMVPSLTSPLGTVVRLSWSLLDSWRRRQQNWFAALAHWSKNVASDA